MEAKIKEFLIKENMVLYPIKSDSLTIIYDLFFKNKIPDDDMLIYEPDILFYIGTYYQVLKDVKKAIEYLEKAIKVNNYMALYKLGCINENMGNYNLAFGYFNRGAIYDEPNALTKIGFIYMFDYEKYNVKYNKYMAISYFDRSAKLYNETAILNLGDIYLKDGNKNKAIDYYKMAGAENNIYALKKLIYIHHKEYHQNNFCGVNLFEIIKYCEQLLKLDDDGKIRVLYCKCLLYYCSIDISNSDISILDKTIKNVTMIDNYENNKITIKILCQAYTYKFVKNRLLIFYNEAMKYINKYENKYENKCATIYSYLSLLSKYAYKYDDALKYIIIGCDMNNKPMSTIHKKYIYDIIKNENITWTPLIHKYWQERANKRLSNEIFILLMCQRNKDKSKYEYINRIINKVVIMKICEWLSKFYKND